MDEENQEIAIQTAVASTGIDASKGAIPKSPTKVINYGKNILNGDITRIFVDHLHICSHQSSPNNETGNCLNVLTKPKKFAVENKESSSQILDMDNDEYLEKYKGLLKNHYQTSYMKSLLWEDKGRDFPLKGYCVDLVIQEVDHSRNPVGKVIKFKNIFEKVSDGHTNILLSGNPGFGKTTLCKKIAHDSTDANYLSCFDFVIVVTLKECDKSIADAVLEAICRNPEAKMKKEILKANLNLLIILDEYKISCKDLIIQFISKDSFDISRKMTILVTSRPHAAKEIREVMDLQFLLLGFLPQQQEEYISLHHKYTKKLAMMTAESYFQQ